MSETGSFLNSPGGQVALIGGVALAGWYVLTNYGKTTAKAATDTVATGVSGVYGGGKEFGAELAADTNKAAGNLGNLLSQGVDYLTGATQNQKVEAAIVEAQQNLSKEGLAAYVASLKNKGSITTAAPIGTSKIESGTALFNYADASSATKLQAQVASAVGYTSANPAVAAVQTAAAKTVSVSAGTPINAAYGATVAKGAQITVGGITYKGV